VEAQPNKLVEWTLPASRARAYRVSDPWAASGRETIYVVYLGVTLLDGRSLNQWGQEATIEQGDLSRSCGALACREIDSKALPL
jgi:hypothetical protein